MKNQREVEVLAILSNMEESEVRAPTREEFSESVATLFRSLPPPIRTFLQGTQKDALMISLTKKYNLHTDQAGEFEKSFLFMLLGVYKPDEFVSTLKEAGLSEEVINLLAQDINEQVFIPLRKAEEGASSASSLAQSPTKNLDISPKIPSSPESPAAAVAAKPVSISASTERHVNRLETVASVPVPQKPTPPPAPTAPPVQPGFPPIQKPKPTNAPERTNREGQTQIRTMASDIEAVKEHRKPSAFFAHGAPPIPVPPRLPVVPSGPGPRTTPPAASFPPSNPVVAAVEKAHALPPLPPASSTTAAPAAPALRTAPPPPNLPGTPLIKEYGKDPYREPME
jgi:hypothetical protein